MRFERVISLVPSLTELVLDIGIDNRLIGRTRFCLYPEDEVSKVEIVGGTKNPNLKKILALKPDLIIANKEENRKEDIEYLKEHTEVLVTIIDTIEEAKRTIEIIGELLDLQKNSIDLVSKVTSLQNLNKDFKPIDTAYFIWKDPWMVAASKTYIDDVMAQFKLKNAFKEFERYPQITIDDLKDKSPELILLSSEPYPFAEKHADELRKLFPSTEIVCINGEWFSWYGSRMVAAFKNLQEWRTDIINS